MACFKNSLLPGCLVLSFLLAAPVGANTRYVSTAGTSSAQGTITIESFSKPSFPGGTGPESPAVMESAHITVPFGSSDVATTTMIRDSIDAQMSANYVPTINPGCSNQVILNYVGPGTSTLNIMDNVPGQKIAEASGSCAQIPTLSEWGLILGVFLVAGLALLILRRSKGQVL